MRLGPIGIALATACIAIAPLMAQPSNLRTDLTFNEPVLIPGKVLPAGHYEFSLVNSGENRNIVEIRNTKTDDATIVIALPDFRTRITDKTVVDFWETPAGEPPALRAWFYPDEQWGIEFAYPTEVANKISAHTETPVPSYDAASNGKLDKKTAQTVSVKNAPRKTMSKK